MTSKITDGRIELIPATLTSLKMEQTGDAALFDLLQVSTPPYWPPELNDDDSFNHFIGMLEANAEARSWGAHYAVDVENSRQLVGSGGYIAPPCGDGFVEIGYSVLTPFRRQGYATAMCHLLIKNAFADARVKCVKATTLPDLTPSIGVLKKLGFEFIGELDGTLTYHLER